MVAPFGLMSMVREIKPTFRSLIKSILVASILYYSQQPIVAQDTIDMVRIKGKPIIVGKLNGKNAYFLVDTGADITILNEVDTKKYKIRYRKTLLKGNMISGLISRHERDIWVATNANFYLGNKQMNACFKVLDLSNIKASIGRKSGVWINGIIGSDMMKQYDFIIDYGTRQVRFTHLESASNTCL